ncbi:hypothetical protein BC332_07337 [Capsicum chinense]|nr:hypothetical protein BC332_07337 [Capsicum chinense]
MKILIDPKALMHVISTEIDFVDDKLKYEMDSVSSFARDATFEQPNFYEAFFLLQDCRIERGGRAFMVRDARRGQGLGSGRDKFLLNGKRSKTFVGG